MDIKEKSKKIFKGIDEIYTTCTPILIWLLFTEIIILLYELDILQNQNTFITLSLIIILWVLCWGSFFYRMFTENGK